MKKKSSPPPDSVVRADLGCHVTVVGEVLARDGEVEVADLGLVSDVVVVHQADRQVLNVGVHLQQTKQKNI